ncbi:MAG: hypothetical protein Tsb007_10550 [Rhizobacter sp.]
MGSRVGDMRASAGGGVQVRWASDSVEESQQALVKQQRRLEGWADIAGFASGSRLSDHAHGRKGRLKALLTQLSHREAQQLGQFVDAGQPKEGGAFKSVGVAWGVHAAFRSCRRTDLSEGVCFQ